MRLRHEKKLHIKRREVNILLARLEWDQNTLADALGVAANTLSQVLTGKRPYSLVPLLIAEVLGVELEHITEGDPAP